MLQSLTVHVTQSLHTKNFFKKKSVQCVGKKNDLPLDLSDLLNLLATHEYAAVSHIAG